MFNLPAATSTHRFPRRDIVTPAGDVLVQPYMFQLAGIAMSVQELDEGYTLGQDDDAMFEKVLTIERRLRSLKAETPKVRRSILTITSTDYYYFSNGGGRRTRTYPRTCFSSSGITT